MPRLAPRPAEKRSVDNELYRRRTEAAGIVAISVRVPSVRVTELKAIALEWRREAKLLLQSDRPSADQILQIHAVCDTLDMPVPPEAFETRATAAAWLHAHERKARPPPHSHPPASHRRPVNRGTAMPDAFPPSRRLLQASLVLLLPFAGTPAFAVPVDLRASNIAPADTRSTVAPVLPVPAVALSAPPITFLRAARQALAGGRYGRGTGGPGTSRDPASGERRTAWHGRDTCPGRHPRCSAGACGARSCRSRPGDRRGDRSTQHASCCGRVPAPGRPAGATPAAHPRCHRCPAFGAGPGDKGASPRPLGVARRQICVGAARHRTSSCR